MNEADPMATVDARGALATIIVRVAEGDALQVQAFANGVTKPILAAILRRVANEWDVEDGLTDP